MSEYNHSSPTHTILLVDSDEARRQLFTHHLARQRYLVYQAAKIAEARVLLSRQRFDALVLDRDLEDGEGLSLLRELMSSAARGDGEDEVPSDGSPPPPPVRIYIESQWPSAERLRELTDVLRVSRVLQKPLTPGELTLQLEASLSGGPSATSGEMAGVIALAPLVRDTVRDLPDLAPRAGALAAEPANADAAAATTMQNVDVAAPAVEVHGEAPSAGDGDDEVGAGDGDGDGDGDEVGAGDGKGAVVEPPPLPDEQNGAERELAALKHEYTRALEGKLDALREMLLGSHQALEGRNQIKRASALAHEIHGTAGSFGYMRVSAAAAVVESALDDILAGSVDRREVRVWREIDAALERALTSAREGAPQGVSPLRRSRHTTTLLVVDEDPDLLAEAQRIGRDNLLQVLVAQSKQRALALATAHPLDGAIIDVELSADDTDDNDGDGDGGESTGGAQRAAGEAGAASATTSAHEGGLSLARALRELEGCADLPLAFVSRQGAIPDRVAAAHAGAALFLTKPLVADELMQTARSFAGARDEERARVLIVDDDDGFVSQISGVLAARQMRVEHLREPERVLEALERLRPDLVLLDTVLPHLSGYDICKLLRASPRWQKLPVIFLTRQTTRRARLACFEVGGDDYLQKPVLIEELLARLQVRLDRQRLERAGSGRDPLTGLMTRAALLSSVERRLAECRRRARPLSLALIEIDDLGQINRQHGERVGDEVLVGLGQLLARRFRLEDLRCRWSGSEFVVAWADERSQSAQRILARALAEYRQMLVEAPGGKLVSPGFAAGIAAFPEDGGAIGDLVRVADSRLTFARQSPGRERIVLSTSM